MSTKQKPAFPVRALAVLKIAYTELQYWLVGLMPETYHVLQSRNYEQLGAYSRAAHHCRRFLELKDHPEVRARLGLCCSLLGQHLDAVREYKKALAQWEHPAIVLALAQAEFRSGNVERARALLTGLQQSQLSDPLRGAIAELQNEMAGW
jgi:tetratricopeptide (TPR) repeat protein